MGKLSRGHVNIFVNLKTARNRKGLTFLLKVSFFLINMHYKFNVLHNVILIDVCIHSLIRLFVHLSIQSFVRPSIRPSVFHSFVPLFLSSFIQPPTNYPKNLLLTDQHTLTVSYVTYQLTANFLLSLRYLIEDTLYNIPHPSSYVLVE